MNNLTLYFIQFTVATIQYLLKISKYLLNTYPFLKKIYTKYLPFSHKNEKKYLLGKFLYQITHEWRCPDFHAQQNNPPPTLNTYTLTLRTTISKNTLHCAMSKGPSPYWLWMYGMSYFRSEGWSHRCHHTMGWSHCCHHAMSEAWAYPGCRRELLWAHLAVH